MALISQNPASALGQRAPRQSGMNPRSLFDSAVITLACLLLIWAAVGLYMSRPDLIGTDIIFSINGTLSIVGFFFALRCGLPLFLIVFFFDYIFFSIAPIQQFGAGFDPIFGDDRIRLIVAIQCLVFTVIALLGVYYRLFLRAKNPRISRFMSQSVHDRFDFDPLILFGTISVLIMGLIAFYGSVLFTSREGLGEFFYQYDKTVVLIVGVFCNAVAFVGSFVGLWVARQRNSGLWLVLFGLLFAGALIIVNPMVTPRFRLSALFLFATLMVLGWNNTRAIALFCIGGVFASPLFNAFRYNIVTTDIRDADTFFANMDYDAASMIAHVVYYVDHKGFSYGENIISYLLFFVPRFIWSDKYDRIAVYLMDSLQLYRGLDNDNLSSPIPAEGYFALGTVGAILLAVVVIRVFIAIERRAEASERNSAWQLIACISPMLVLILLRGPLIVGYSEFWGYALAVLISVTLLRARFFSRKLTSVRSWQSQSGAR